MKHRADLLLFPERLTRSFPAATPSTERGLEASGGPAAGAPSTSPRYLLLYLPAFALERCGYQASQHAVCVAEQQGAARVVSLTPTARHEGVRVGMAVAQARALLPELEVIEHDPLAERADQADLLRCFRHLGERLAPWGPGGLLLEIHRVAHLFGGERSLARQVSDRATALGHVACVVVADDPCAAQALAEWGGEDRLVPPGGGAQALAPLPFASLRPSPPLLAATQALGIERVGEWARFEPASIGGRFGVEGLRLLRLARGEPVTPLPWNEPDPGPVIERVVLGGPTSSLGPILFVLPGTLQRLRQQLLARDAMAVRLAVRLVLDRGAPQVIRVRVGTPSRDPDRLESLIRARLERARLTAPAIELHLEVEEHTAERLWQLGLLERSAAAEPLADLIARLTDTLGDDAVFGAAPRASWIPEQAWVPRPFLPGEPLPAPPLHRKADRDPVAIQRQLEPRPAPPRPTVLLSAPMRVQVQVVAGRPAQLRFEGRWHRLQSVEGPERLEPEWWRLDGPHQRDYWAIRFADRTAWCFCDDRKSWFLHGWFD
ncbi:MAG: DNA polymerase Y family protein [Deltaproteobacteria bacterium]|nr:MAG: DNA polymerase Y family protein [Deltaproteobacteria bacterium]